MEDVPLSTLNLPSNPKPSNPLRKEVAELLRVRSTELVAGSSRTYTKKVFVVSTTRVEPWLILGEWYSGVRDASGWGLGECWGARLGA